MSKERRFLKDLAKLLKKHDVSLCIFHDYADEQTDFEFDIVNHSYDNEICRNCVNVEIDYKHIELLLKVD